MTDERAMPPDLFHQLTLTILDRSVDEGLRTIKSIRTYLDTWETFLQDRQQLLDHLLIDHNNASPPDLDADPGQPQPTALASTRQRPGELPGRPFGPGMTIGNHPTAIRATY